MIKSTTTTSYAISSLLFLTEPDLRDPVTGKLAGAAILAVIILESVESPEHQYDTVSYSSKYACLASTSKFIKFILH